MSFNKGFLCPNCGPVQESKKRSAKNVQFDSCKTCGAPVSKWERPLNERIGRCGNCGNSGFKMALWKSQILRKCKTCNEVYNIDTETVKRKGEKQYEYKPGK